MRPRIQAWCAAGMMVAAVSAGYARGAEALLPTETFAALRENGELHQETLTFSLCPNTPLAAAAVAAWEYHDAPTYSAESLYYLPKAELTGGKNPAEDVSLARAAQVVRMISTMQGIQYYSNGDKKWETLYTRAYMIENSRSKRAIPDQTDGDADGKTFFCLLDDHSFGQNVYQLDYRQSANEVSVRFTNVDAVKVAMITGVKPRRMNINLVVTDCGDSFLVYMVVQATHPKISFLEKRLRRSLAARVDAIYGWFKSQF